MLRKMLIGIPSVSLGNPIIKYDSEGNVIEWTATQPIILDGKTYIDTGFKLWQSYMFNWELNIVFEYKNSDDDSTLLHCSNMKVFKNESKLFYQTSNSGGVLEDVSRLRIIKIGSTYSGFPSVSSTESNQRTLIIGAQKNDSTFQNFWKGTITSFSIKHIPNTEQIIADAGSPKITYNPDHNIIKYEFTNTPVTFSSSGQNTGFIPFDGNFKLHMKVTPNSGNANYATLIHALYESEDGYKGFIIRKRGISSITRWWRLIIGSDEHNLNAYMTDGNSVTIDITRVSKTMTTVINGTTVNTASFAADESCTIWIGSDSGGNNPVKATIHEFSVTRIE